MCPEGYFLPTSLMHWRHKFVLKAEWGETLIKNVS